MSDEVQLVADIERRVEYDIPLFGNVITSAAAFNINAFPLARHNSKLLELSSKYDNVSIELKSLVYSIRAFGEETLTQIRVSLEFPVPSFATGEPFVRGARDNVQQFLFADYNFAVGGYNGGHLLNKPGEILLRANTDTTRLSPENFNCFRVVIIVANSQDMNANINGLATVRFWNNDFMEV